MTAPSRLEATINLVCAAMTVLVCGQYVEDYYLPERKEGVSLCEEFAPWFNRHSHFSDIFRHIVQRPSDTVGSIWIARLSALLRIPKMPSQVAAAFECKSMSTRCGDMRRDGNRAASAQKLAEELGIQRRYVVTILKDPYCDDDLWEELRAELYRLSEREGLL